jgi:Zn-dependent alcohol dehydrogenase
VRQRASTSRSRWTCCRRPFDLDAFVSETIGLEDVEAAFEKMHKSDVQRSSASD